jgi:ABC-type multidrug transport system fused ATPase/permease subunit
VSGTGKSSIAKLMARLYDARTGTVQFRGQDVRDIPIEQLRKRVHYMPQTPILFSGSTVDNLRYADPTVSREYIWMALESVGLSAAIKAFPANIDEDLGPAANRLSGGERQRLALARAIVAQPQVLILDESTAFLDAPIEKQIYAALRETLVATALVVITHRLSTITWADRMVLIESGRVVVEGTHRTLYDTNHDYRHMVDQLVQGATEVEHR